ncbi:MAG: M20 family metallopeptidase [Anaerolineae bacterium]|nr:M20 family metallopeptidase [Anaerolineae bacterium]
MTADLRSYFDAQIESMVDLVGDLVMLESPTSNKEAVDRMGQRIAEGLARLGAALTIHPRTEVGDIVEARWNTATGETSAAPVLMICHMDTVHPIGAISGNPLRRDGKRLYGPGSYDMKGSIATMLVAIRGLFSLGLFPPRPVIVLMTSDEETGSSHSRDLIEDRARDAALAMIMEPALPDGAVKTWRKSTGEFTICTFGVSAHAGGAHELGVNAIQEMAHQILALQKLTDYTTGSTISVGMVSGGTARNTVPDHCRATVDVRAMTVTEIERMTSRIRSLKPVLPGARVEVSGKFDRPPMERNNRMLQTFMQAQEIAARHGIALKEAGSGGASDGNYTAALGTPTLDGLGPTGDGAHSENEHILIDSLPASATLIAALLLDWPGTIGVKPGVSPR